ncbi:unnamed protein product [Rotaria sp. Silwood1]|nr:unnamed protein product [Rotaria sp. Silwood1]CAF1364820.1 unnamed protein product [Rotaria sp. Silwood1]
MKMQQSLLLVSPQMQQLTKYPIKISFVIHPDRTDTYDAFQLQIYSLGQQEGIATKKSVSTTVEPAKIEVEKGDITKQPVDVIIGSSSSENLKQILLEAEGKEVENAYDEEAKNNPPSSIISTLSGQLPGKRIFFLKWEPNTNPETLKQSIIDLIWNVIQNTTSYKFTSIAFLAIGCGEHACPVHIVVKTMVKEMKQQIQNRNLSWSIKFIIEPNQDNVYDEFCTQLLLSNQEPIDYQLPSTWQTSKEDTMRFTVPKNTDEYKSIFISFDETMKKIYQEIIKIERIQNERWTAYGVGVYFSSSVVYSHAFTRSNANRERCMFVSRVLIGKITLENRSMKSRPLGFDSTTDGYHIFVTYHDAQTYAEYLITYR